MREPILLGWSGGKDCAHSLYELEREARYEITLLTTITEGYDRISMHGVRESLLDAQVEAIGLPVEKLFIPQSCTNETYGRLMKEALERHIARGVRRMAFGDIFLEDVRAYREGNLALVGMEAIFPIWGRESHELARSFLELGFRAIITCVDTVALDRGFAGALFSTALLESFPASVDPCGENGEFHSFVFDGPIFSHRVDFSAGEVVLRDERFCFCDLVPPEGR